MARKCSVERAEMKAGGFATAKKNITIQYQGRERNEENLLALIMKIKISSIMTQTNYINILEIFPSPI